ncbi:thioredoxin [Tirmania nivea]|nr:thioredoxin [Tirmania nivea]
MSATQLPTTVRHLLITSNRASFSLFFLTTSSTLAGTRARTISTKLQSTVFRPSAVSTKDTTIIRSPFSAFYSTHVAQMVKEINSKTAFTEAINQDKLVVLDCYATWCGPCRLIAPKVTAFSEDYPDVAFYKLDVDDVSDVAAELGVKAMPTFYFFKKGEKVDEVVGANPAALKVSSARPYA